MPITRKEFDAGKVFWWRKILRAILAHKLWRKGTELLANALYLLSWLCKRIADRISVSNLRSNPEVIQAIERSMEARREGRVKPWSEVKKELGLQ